jgi:Astacin (Peptidase family M12A)
LNFVPYDEAVHKDFVNVTGSGSGCFSSVGRRGGMQVLNLQPGKLEDYCFRLYTIVHEFIHAIGFYHMQSATERDDYVRIDFDSITPGSEHNFNKYGFETVNNFDVEYDYGSVMHYSKTAFSSNGQDTIIALRDLNGETMGQRLKLSAKDIERVKQMYCSEEATTTAAPSTSTSAPQTTTAAPQTTTSRPSVPNPVPEFVKSVNDWVRNLLGNILGNFGN